MLLTRAPLSSIPKDAFPFDLHVLGTPPAFILSQDQTLRFRWGLTTYVVCSHYPIVKLLALPRAEITLPTLPFPVKAFLPSLRAVGSTLIRLKTPAGLSACCSHPSSHYLLVNLRDVVPHSNTTGRYYTRINFFYKAKSRIGSLRITINQIYILITLNDPLQFGTSLIGTT